MNSDQTLNKLAGVEVQNMTIKYSRHAKFNKRIKRKLSTKGKSATNSEETIKWSV